GAARAEPRRGAGRAAVRRRLRHGDRHDDRRPPRRPAGRGGGARPLAPRHRAHRGRLPPPRPAAPRLPPRLHFPPVILAIDQGTTGSTCIVFDEQGRIAGRSYSEFEQHFPRPGWVEHDANEIWEVTRRVAHEAIDDAGIQGSDLAGIGITNQRETVVAWDRSTAEPL